ITWENQKWNGWIPDLINNVENKIMLIKSILLYIEKILSQTLEKIITREAMACTKKYLIAVSVEEGFNFTTSNGIILIRLISSPSQHVNHLEAIIATNLPIIKVVKTTN